MRSLFLLCLAAGILTAQDPAVPDAGNGTSAITAASQFFDHDFVNLYAFADAIVAPHLLDSNNTSYRTGFGWDVGGGITATHSFHDGSFSINYRGGYADNHNLGLSGGENQFLTFAYEKRLNRHWTLGASISGAILTYGTSYYSGESISSVTSGNPFTPQTRFANAGLSLTYAQTRRLSYVFSGAFMYNDYSLPGMYNSRGVTGSVGAYYRLTARTTVGGSYSHSYFTYSGGGGSGNTDGAYLTLSHIFPDRWQASVSGGFNRVNSSGTVTIPVSFVFAGQTLTGYYTGPYNRTVYSPVFQGVVSHQYHRSFVSLSGGQSVMQGNGFYLASRSQFVNGTLSFASRHTSLGFGGNYVRLSSEAATITQPYSYYGFSAAYGINLIRYVSANIRYDLIHYDGFLSLSTGSTEQRISLGLSVSSKSVPLTLF